MTGLREKAIEAFCASDGITRYIDSHTQYAIEAVVAVCMEEAAPLVEQAFRHGIGYAQNVKVDDADLAWETSQVRAALRALRGEGGVDDG